MQQDTDTLVLTAANRAQARAYQAQLAGRGLPVRQWLVIPDPGDQRVGSGGSTIAVLSELSRRFLRQNRSARSFRDLFEGRRILIIHSGGDSRRLCAYAAQGKVFLPLPCSNRTGRPAVLFDLILDSLIRLPVPPRGHVLIASGDALLTMAPEALDFHPEGVTGVAYPGSLERGKRHGVYVSARDGRVVDVLQKPDEHLARTRNAVDAVGRVLVDTGLVSLGPEAVERLLATAGAEIRRGKVHLDNGILRDMRRGRSFNLDLYTHVLMALPAPTALEEYLSKVGPPAGARARKALVELFNGLRGTPFRLNVLPYCDFFHIGSTRELLRNVGLLSRTARNFGFSNLSWSVVADGISAEGAFIYNSILRSPDARLADGAVLEAVHSGGRIELKGNNLVVGWPESAQRSLRLPRDLGLLCLPIRGKEKPWAVVLFGSDDDFKTPLGAAGTFGNRPMNEVFERCGLSVAGLWKGLPANRRTLWEARLWRVGAIDAVLRQTLWMADLLTPAGDSNKAGVSPEGGTQEGRTAALPGSVALRTEPPDGWRLGRKQSMAELVGMVDLDRILSHRTEIQRLVALQRLGQRLLADPWLPSETVLGLIRSKSDATSALRQIDRLVSQGVDPLTRPRLYRLAFLIHRRHGTVLPSQPRLRGRTFENAAFESVAEAIQQQAQAPLKPRRSSILHDQVVWVTCPVRVDFAGGWSDTPPACNELGGTVLNAAITLNGQYPVQVVAKLSERRTVTLTSLDLGERVEITRPPSPAEYRDPTRWSALPKAALVASGICLPGADSDTGDWLDALGGGLDLTLFSAIPKGSGLGTSSILGAALIACLARVVGEDVTREALIARTSVLEQMMTTGGGWQDQIGGIVPGVKLIRTAPGLDQTPALHRTVFESGPGTEFRARLLLYYTGYRRMAKNILRNVVGRYLARDTRTLEIIHRLKDLAEEMNISLSAVDIEGFGSGINRYWELKKHIDPGATNRNIEALIGRVERYLSGKVLPGAGGGGFVFMLARDEGAARQIRRVLERNPPNKLARFFDFEIDHKGLSATVL